MRGAPGSGGGMIREGCVGAGYGGFGCQVFSDVGAVMGVLVVFLVEVLPIPL